MYQMEENKTCNHEVQDHILVYKMIGKILMGCIQQSHFSITQLTYSSQNKTRRQLNINDHMTLNKHYTTHELKLLEFVGP